MLHVKRIMPRSYKLWSFQLDVLCSRFKFHNVKSKFGEEDENHRNVTKNK